MDPVSFFHCEEQQSLLHGMEATRIIGSAIRCIPAGCRGGGCGQCKIRVVEGDYWCKKMSAKHIDDAAREKGFVLACRCYPRSDLVFTTAGV
jgi:ferredoxin